MVTELILRLAGGHFNALALEKVLTIQGWVL